MRKLEKRDEVGAFLTEVGNPERRIFFRIFGEFGCDRGLQNRVPALLQLGLVSDDPIEALSVKWRKSLAVLLDNKPSSLGFGFFDDLSEFIGCPIGSLVDGEHQLGRRRQHTYDGEGPFSTLGPEQRVQKELAFGFGEFAPMSKSDVIRDVVRTPMWQPPSPDVKVLERHGAIVQPMRVRSRLAHPFGFESRRGLR